MDHNFTRRRELDPIAEEVHQDLPQPRHVAHHPRRQAVIHMIGDFDLFLGGLGGQQVQGILDALVQSDRLLLQLQLA